MIPQPRIPAFVYSALIVLITSSIGVLSQYGGRLAAVSAQDRLWRDLPTGALGELQANQQTWVTPKQYRAFNLDEVELDQVLAGAPLEFTEAAKDAKNEISLPRPDGKLARFRFVESPIMEPKLAAQFPGIKTYRAWGIDDPAATARFDRTSGGLHAMILSPQGSSYVNPLFRNNTRTYASYFVNDAPGSGNAGCLVGPGGRADQRSDGIRTRRSAETPGPVSNALNGRTLRTFRLAVATTAEYTALFGTAADAMNNGVVPTINHVTAIYQDELAVNFMLISNVPALISTDPLTDPYTSGNTVQLLTENQCYLDQQVGSMNYDIGHVFDLNNVGGRANLGAVCHDGDKGKGVSGQLQPLPGGNFELMVAHEFGHQFGANHTFNGTLGECGTQLNNATAYEPGSGSTIMSYAGRCGDDSLQLQVDSYFHGMNLEEMVSFLNNQGSCAMTSNNGGNTPPAVSIPLPPTGQFVIPARTPFTMTATAQDAEDSFLTYCWEDRDNGTPGSATEDRGDNPLFRSWRPTSAASRTFPRLLDLLDGRTSTGETLPTTTRQLLFVVTVRDGHPSGGGFAQRQTAVDVQGQMGPFAVTQPAAGAQAHEGQPLSITWDVAGTNLPPIGTANVRILLSTDDGFNFPTTLAASTPNDGSFTAVVPRADTERARVKVEAVDNIYFNISRKFTIIPNTRPQISPVLDLHTTQGGTTPAPVQIATVSDLEDPPAALKVSATPIPLPDFTPPPPGLSVEVTQSNGAVMATATTTCDVQQGTYRALLTVEDSLNAISSKIFQVVVDPNPPPTIGNYNPASVTAGATVNIFPNALPSDPNNAMTFSVSPTMLPGGGLLSIGQSIGNVRVEAPAGTRLGVYPVTVKVQDACNASVSRTFNLTIRTATCPIERGWLYVADAANHRIQVYDGSTWRQLGAPGNGLGQFNNPRAVVASLNNQTIYVADFGNNRLQWSQDGGATWAVFAA
ncbi:MAG TPA: M12 family metallo-peptidase, partial [Blastocatellia bacterium]|nr:M12 family metallo-peptidase [Blastocatellia bacterium]